MSTPFCLIYGASYAPFFQGSMYLWACPSGQRPLCDQSGRIQSILPHIVEVFNSCHSLLMPDSANPDEDKNSVLRSAIWLFVALNCLFLLTTTGRVRTMDEVMTYFTTSSLALHGTTAVPQAQSAGLFYGKLDINGVARAAYPVGQPLVSVPWFLVGDYILLNLPEVPPQAHDPVMAFAVTCSNATITAFIGALAYLLFCAMGLTLRASLYTTLAMIFGTQLFAYSGWYFSEPLTTALLLAATLALFDGTLDLPLPISRVILAGAILGAAVWVRPTQIISVAIFAFALLIREWPRGNKQAVFTTLNLGFSSGFFVLAYLVNNKRLFGSSFDFGYPSTAEFGHQLNGFTTPFFTGFTGFLFSPGKSIFLFAPVIIAAIFALPLLWKRDRGLATLAAAMPIASLLFYSKYAQWEGGYCYGPRYFVPALALLCISLAPVFAGASSKLKTLAIIGVAAGTIINLIGLSTSFLENQATRGIYYDSGLNYVWSHSSITAQAFLFWKYLIEGDNTSIGLGFDRWFVFLHKAGVGNGVIIALAIIPIIGLILSFNMYRKNK